LAKAESKIGYVDVAESYQATVSGKKAKRHVGYEYGNPKKIWIKRKRTSRRWGRI